MLEVLLDLANRGIDVLRLDAAPFLWKRLGTNCQNQPEAHLIVQALRALVRIAAPAVAFKAEAIVAPDDLVQYLGAHEHYRPECDLAYHNQLMVMLWSSLATRDARLATVALRRLRPAPPESGWVTYVRCHDDIGWAVSDEDAWAVGLEPVRAPALPRVVLRRPDRRAASPAARCSRPTRRPATPGRPAAPPRCAASSRRSCDGRRGGDHGRRTAAAAALLGRLLLRRHPAGLHGRRARAVRRRGLGQPARPGGRQPLDAPAAHGLAAGRAAARRRRRSRAGSSPACSALGAVRPTVPAFGLGGATQVLDAPDARLLAYLRTHPRGRRRCWSWPTSATRRSRWRRSGSRACCGRRARAGRAGPSGRSRPALLHGSADAQLDERRLRLDGSGFAWLTSR